MTLRELLKVTSKFENILLHDECVDTASVIYDEKNPIEEKLLDKEIMDIRSKRFPIYDYEEEKFVDGSLLEVTIWKYRK